MEDKSDPLKPTPNESLRRPGNIDHDDFRPMILSTLRSGCSGSSSEKKDIASNESRWEGPDTEWIKMLVCWKRVVRSGFVDEQHPIPAALPEPNILPNGQNTSEIAYFPVAILLQNPVQVLYGLTANAHFEHREWIVDNLSVCGMAQRSAGAALAAAWRGVNEISPGWPEPNKVRFKYKNPTLTYVSDLHASDMKLKPQEYTLLRDVAMWINWDHWDSFRPKPFTIIKRASILTKWGFPSTPKAVRQAKEKVGV